jgi:hypothetical protein
MALKRRGARKSTITMASTLAGAEGMTEVVAATGGLVVVRGKSCDAWIREEPVYGGRL